MGLLEKKSLKLDAVEDFEWSPSEPIMCIYHRESQEGNIPAKINLMKLPGRTEIRQKNLFNVSSRLNESLQLAVWLLIVCQLFLVVHDVS